MPLELLVPIGRDRRRHRRGAARRRTARLRPIRAAQLQPSRGARLHHQSRLPPHPGEPDPRQPGDAGGRALARRKLDDRSPAAAASRSSSRPTSRSPTATRSRPTMCCFRSRRRTTRRAAARWPTWCRPAARRLEVTATDPHTVVITFPAPFAPGIRILDDLPILPRHKLEGALKAGTFRKAWGLDTPPSEIVGLGPFSRQRVRARASASSSRGTRATSARRRTARRCRTSIAWSSRSSPTRAPSCCASSRGSST